VVSKTPFEAGPEDVLACDGIILGTTENLGYMSGALKDFFDRTYYGVIEEKQGLPLGVYIRAGLDGTGTRRAIESITGGLRWKLVQEPMILHGEWDEAFVDQVEELGLAMAAGLEAGVF
jgi:multimeric flavodoxin WrbA